MKYFLLSLISVFLISSLWYFQNNQEQEIFHINSETTYTDDFLDRSSFKTNGHNVWTKDSVFCEVKINDKVFSDNVARLEFWNHVKLYDSEIYSFQIKVNKKQDDKILSLIDSKPFQTRYTDMSNGYIESYYYNNRDSTMGIIRHVTLNDDVNSYSYSFKFR